MWYMTAGLLCMLLCGTAADQSLLFRLRVQHAHDTPLDPDILVTDDMSTAVHVLPQAYINKSAHKMQQPQEL